MPNPKLETYKNKATGDVYDYTDADAQGKLTAILDGTTIDSFSDVESALDDKADESTVEAILNGTSLDSFGDVETALADKVDVVAGKGLSTNDYDDTEKTKVAGAVQWADAEGYVGKNLVSVPPVQTIGNSTFVADKDGYVTSAQSDQRSWGYDRCNVFKALKAGSYVLRVFRKTASTEGYNGFKLYNGNTIIYENSYIEGAVDAEDIPFTLSANTTVGLFYKVGNGAYAFQITKTGVPTTPYESYVIDNSELMPLSVNNRTGAHNVCNVSLESYKKKSTHGVWNGNVYTDNGITYTLNDDMSVTLDTNGQASTEDGGFYSNYELPAGDYILSGCEDGSAGSYFLDTYESEWTNRNINYNGDTPFSFSDGSNTHVIRIFIKAGTVISNKTIKPMIRVADDKDNTYTKPAMTNQQLTEKVTVKSDSITSSFTANGDVANRLKKIGEIVFIDAAYKEVTASQWDVIATIPAGFRPKTPCRILDGFGKKSLVINVNGDIQAAESISNTYVYIHGSWVVS